MAILFAGAVCRGRSYRRVGRLAGALLVEAISVLEPHPNHRYMACSALPVGIGGARQGFYP